MKARLALIVAIAQGLLLAFMAGQREWIARTGTPLTLRTAPIDPNDPMRGNYVRFEYEINTVPIALCQGELLELAKGPDQQRRTRDRVVFAALKVDANGLATLVSLSATQPASPPFLRGRLESIDQREARVRYGVEAMFVQQEHAKKIEDLSRHEKSGAPINTHIVVGASGIGVLQDYEWEPLGLTLAFDPPPPRAAGNPTRPVPARLLTGLTASLHNYSDQEIAVVDLAHGRSFRLVVNESFGAAHYDWAGQNRAAPAAPQPGDVVVLQPGATREIHLDLTQPDWWIKDRDQPGAVAIPLQQLTDGWSATFRIEYVPPSVEASRDLPHGDLIRHVPLRSRSFNANQGVD